MDNVCQLTGDAEHNRCAVHGGHVDLPVVFAGGWERSIGENHLRGRTGSWMEQDALIVVEQDRRGRGGSRGRPRPRPVQAVSSTGVRAAKVTH